MNARTQRVTAASQLRARVLQAAFLGILSLSPAAWAQTDAVYHVHGRVLNASTHHPIARALVATNDHRLATMTDTNGNFAFDVTVAPQEGGPDVPSRAASGGVVLTLTATRPGFVAQEYSQQVELNSSTAAKSVTLGLLPLADISGTIDAEAIGPVPNVQVLLLEHQVSDGAFIWMQRGAQATGERGQFRFDDLEPGEYTITTREWEGDAPAYLRESRQYPPRFAGDAANLAAATKLQLRYGSDDQVRLHLREAAYYPVHIPVQVSQQRTGISVQVLADGAPFGYSLGWNGRDNAVEGSLPSGAYTVLISSGVPQAAYARVPLTVSESSAQHAPVTLAPAAMIRIHVRLDFTEDESNSGGFAYSGNPSNMPTQASPVDVDLTSTEASGISFNSQRRQAEDPILEQVAPGTYAVRARTIRGYVASVSAGGIDLMQQPLRVGDTGSADPIDVTVRNDSGTLTGVVEMDAEQLAFVSVLLVAADGSGHSAQGYAQRGGKLSVQNIPPGTYRAFATSPMQSQQLPYRDANAMQPFERLGTLVTVAANQTVDLKLQYIPLLGAEGEAK